MKKLLESTSSFCVVGNSITIFEHVINRLN